MADWLLDLVERSAWTWTGLAELVAEGGAEHRLRMFYPEFSADGTPLWVVQIPNDVCGGDLTRTLLDSGHFARVHTQLDRHGGTYVQFTGRSLGGAVNAAWEALRLAIQAEH